MLTVSEAAAAAGKRDMSTVPEAPEEWEVECDWAAAATGEAAAAVAALPPPRSRSIPGKTGPP